MTLFLHVGFPKTGTSSIQVTLHRAGDQLRRSHLINFPKFGSNHWMIALPFLENQRWGRLERQVARTGRSELEFRREGEVLLKEFERTQTKFRHNILSSEHFVGLQEASARNLLTYLESICPDIKVILYVRHPAEDVSSRVQQNIKTGRRSLADLERRIEIRQEPELQRLSTVYGKERVIARRFGYHYFKNNDLIDDFMSIVDPAEDFSHIPRINMNESLSLPAVMLIDKINSVAHDDPAIVRKRKIFETMLKSIRGPKFLLPRSLVECYVDDHQRFLDHLRTEYDLVFDEVDMSKFPDKLSYEFSDDTLQSIAEVLYRERVRRMRQRPLARIKRVIRRLTRKPKMG